MNTDIEIMKLKYEVLKLALIASEGCSKKTFPIKLDQFMKIVGLIEGNTDSFEDL